MVQRSDNQGETAVTNRPENVARRRFESLDNISTGGDDLRFALYDDGLWCCERKGAIGGDISRCFPDVFAGLDIESEGVRGLGAIECEDEFFIDDDWRAAVAVNGWVGMVGVRPDEFTVGRQARGALVSEVSIESCDW